MNNRVMLISSAGGHFAQLKQLIPSVSSQEYCIVTEKNLSTSNDKSIKYFLYQQDRKNKFFIFIMLANILKSIVIVIRERPKFIITTGAGAVLPVCVLGKLLNSKIIFIESFAKINTPTITGKIIYHFADRFYVQWEEMLKHYPNAIYKGTIY